jgi:hypothetical protein
MSKNSRRKLSEDVRDKSASLTQTQQQQKEENSLEPRSPIPVVNTTIQGWPVTLHKYKGHTMLTFVSAEPPDQAKFMAAYGSQDPDFVFGLIRQLANVTPRIRRSSSVYRYEGEPPDVETIKFALDALAGMEPRDTLDV